MLYLDKADGPIPSGVMNVIGSALVLGHAAGNTFQRRLASGRVVTVHKHQPSVGIRLSKDPEMNAEVDRVIADMPNRPPGYDVISEAERRLGRKLK